MVPEPALDAPAAPGKTARVTTILAIAGCGPRLEIALAAPTLAAPALAALAGPTPRSDLIVAAVDLLLRGAGVGGDALDAVVASRGPGSFTGIRVALATAQGLAAAHGAAGHAFSSLVVQASRSPVRPCLAVQPARRGHVFAQRFGGEGGDGEPEVVPLEALAASTVPVIAPAGLAVPGGTPLAPASLTAAEALLALAAALERPDAATLVPLYLENPLVHPPVPRTPSWQRSHRDS